MAHLIKRTMSSSSGACQAVRSTTASGSIVYESERAVNEYLQYHYGKGEDVLPYKNGPQNALEFIEKTVKDCSLKVPDNQRRRALDVGCAVGRSTLEFSKYFDESVGIDFSHRFIDAAINMRDEKQMEYIATIHGDIQERRMASIPENVDASKVHFEQGNACELPESLGTFDAVLASNLLCRLPEPQQFIDRLPSLINSGGVLALISPYSWLEEYTPKQKWIGGYIGADGEVVDSFDELSRALSVNFELIHREDYPFLIREHARKYQWGISDGTFWRRK